MRDSRDVELLGRAHTLRVLFEHEVVELSSAEIQYVRDAEKRLADGKQLPRKQAEVIDMLFTLHYKTKMRAKLREAENARKQREAIKSDTEGHGDHSV